MRKLLITLVSLGALVLTGRWILDLPAVQDRVLEIGSSMIAQRGAAPLKESVNLRVYICGSGSPLGRGQAQACIAVLTPKHFFIIDSGAGSTDNITALNLPTERLSGVLISHLHSDHIAELYELNLNSWVRGRQQPMLVMGPKGIEDVVNGVNASYKHDRKYRSSHHGDSMLPPELGVISHRAIEPGTVFDDGNLKITAYPAAHPPIDPSIGYRIDYKGRSVVISGDSNVTSETLKIATDIDLLLHDALHLPTVRRLSKSLSAAGRSRPAKITSDILDYHASTDSLLALAEDANINMLGFYHLVPIPPNSVTEKAFMRDTPDNFILAKDRMWFELPADTDSIVVHAP